ncbi:anti-sigma-I factor RsgI family protein [Desulforamulus hydrothermalis]|uniref:RsgI N-terminal anti-sigma domain-containing protein n=1 Tax=Desulforamulus hydrothermalis Lam5 = DSM 18033 TaxID=1121428 RepID=K8E0W4_9FIRM|nr:hypothetical protein [Desulforamulus hydrothermalis]CCO09294.1 conserved hypothetical protein [Desulforamulus hydrothermalis Lam5 = DSM 18033]SHH04751.1 hypothetical protein SAMN02745177_01245 [Desulforamulus hydrothermalis Lam5 = DSM 18033]
MVKGILVQAKGPLGVVMTPEGRFVRVILSKHRRELGQEVTGMEVKIPAGLPWGAAAAVLLLVCFLSLWNPSRPAAAAYVTLDINPSLELAVNPEGKVIKGSGLDEEGRQLVKKVDFGQLSVYQAVQLLVSEAARHNYINHTNNIVLVTVTPLRENTGVVDEAKLAATVQQVAAVETPGVKVISERATVEEHQLAAKKGISVGRYLIHRNSHRQGLRLSLEQVKKKGLGQLEKETGIELQRLLPHAQRAEQQVLQQQPSAHQADTVNKPAHPKDKRQPAVRESDNRPEQPQKAETRKGEQQPAGRTSDRQPQQPQPVKEKGPEKERISRPPDLGKETPPGKANSKARAKED